MNAECEASGRGWAAWAQVILEGPPEEVTFGLRSGAERSRIWVEDTSRADSQKQAWSSLQIRTWPRAAGETRAQAEGAALRGPGRSWGGVDIVFYWRASSGEWNVLIPAANAWLWLPVRDGLQQVR